MATTAVIFTRYNNDVSYLRRYPKHPHIEYICIDDGSEDDPVLPEFWKVYKITEDIGWNSEGAKNLGMHVMESDWGVTCDMDHPILVEDIPKLPIITEFLPRTASYNPIRIDGKAINCHLAHIDLWNEIGGYDETFTTLYGYDKTFAHAVNAKRNSAVLRLECIRLDMIGGMSAVPRTEKKRSNQDFLKLEAALKAGEAEYTKERLRFPWKRIA